MAKRFVLIFTLMLLIIVPFSKAVPSGQGQQLFFDNFSSSQLSPNWNVMPTFGVPELGNVSQAGGWLTLSDPRNSFVASSFTPITSSFMATQITPIVTSTEVFHPSNPSLAPALDGNKNNITYNGGGSSTTLSLAGTVSGNFYIAFAQISGGFGAAPQINSLSGSNDNGWTLRNSIFAHSNFQRLYEFYTTGKGGADTVTINLNNACGGSNCLLLVGIFGVKNVTGFDTQGAPFSSCQTNNYALGTFLSSWLPAIYVGAAGLFSSSVSLSPDGANGLVDAFSSSWGTGSGVATNFDNEYQSLSHGDSSWPPDGVAWNIGSSVSSCILGDDLVGTAGSLPYSVPTNPTTGFVYMVWRVVPFNLTQIGNNAGQSGVIRNAVAEFGLFQQNATVFGFPGPGFLGNGIGFQVVETDSVFNNPGLSLGGMRESVNLILANPMYTGTGTTGNGSVCFVSTVSGLEPFPIGCAVSHPSIVYSNNNAPFDLNTAHLFTMEANLKVDGSSWVAFQVDNSGWMNLTQTACSCIESNAPKGYNSLFPFINSVYFASLPTSNLGGMKASVPPSQSLGTLVNYVLVDNFVPSNIPTGSTPPLNPTNNPLSIPTTNNPLFNPFGGINPAALWQFYANTIGNGVPVNTGNFVMSPFYFGGSVLYVITILGILGVLFFVMDFRGGRITSPFILGMIIFFDTVFNFLMGTLIWWIFASVSIFMMAIMVGSIPSSLGGSSGGVSI